MLFSGILLVVEPAIVGASLTFVRLMVTSISSSTVEVVGAAGGVLVVVHGHEHGIGVGSLEVVGDPGLGLYLAGCMGRW